MKQLSIYDFFSFLAPRVATIGIIQYISEQILGYQNIFAFATQSWEMGVLWLVIAFFVGCLIHVFTFSVMFKYKWFQKIACKDMNQIKNDAYVERLLPKLQEHFKQKIPKEEFSKANLFDFAYYSLEAKGKIAQAKSFQSIHFLFRNMTFLMFFISALSLILAVFVQCPKAKVFVINSFVCMVLGFVFGWLSQWFRMKMSNTVFGMYHADFTDKTEK